jgi:hypothetical protein
VGECGNIFFGHVLVAVHQGQRFFAHLRKFGLQMDIGRGATASKAEAIYFPPPRHAYAASGTSRFLVDGTGFVEFSESFKYVA